LDEPKGGLVEKLWKRACDGRLQFTSDEYAQLALFYAAAQIEGEGLDLERPPKSLLDQMEAAGAEADVRVSKGQQLVSDILTELEIDHKMEVSERIA